MKIVNWFLLVSFGALLIHASMGLPNRGDGDAVMFREKSPAGSWGASSYYIRNAYRDAETPNMVTVVLADYRGYDTLGEETVIMTAGLICYLLLRKKRTNRDEKKPVKAGADAQT
ncbi:MAG: hydrogen gas-evolving membrane-bound hydrogenase subunit E [Candidatus Deferrimicrobiaceae bacterium]